MTIHFGNPKPVQSVSDAVSLYGVKEFDSPTLSTIPMLSLLIHAPTVFDDVIKRIDFPSNHDRYLEYTVAPQYGRGKASHTDLMLKSGQKGLAIEAKWTESMYPTAGKWLGQGNNKSNKTKVLSWWLKLLNDRTGQKLTASDVHDVIYQMIHRAASAATFHRPIVAYFLFKENGKKQGATATAIQKKLSELWVKLGRPKTFPFFVVEIEMTALPPYEAIRTLPKRDETTSDAVMAALQDSKELFKFKLLDCKKVEVVS